MKNIYYLFLIALLVSCTKEKTEDYLIFKRG